ncbi:hypothetical protein I6B53_08210 [Schaalia sp. 19OD2882]|uniref:hypothetical protein n=1 Tax=Schaalia sp. 19OD2882 TaxID=2794089 RepID=UPI001C1EEF8B|nr:hypothetical protein [Schaalia sp. 19OD2882]QWW19097.1 hypothetical protein I6B53_08210 [Schaalia sp. 19OD2882]
MAGRYICGIVGVAHEAGLTVVSIEAAGHEAAEDCPWRLRQYIGDKIHLAVRDEVEVLYGRGFKYFGVDADFRHVSMDRGIEE